MNKVDSSQVRTKVEATVSTTYVHRSKPHLQLGRSHSCSPDRGRCCTCQTALLSERPACGAASSPPKSSETVPRHPPCDGTNLHECILQLKSGALGRRCRPIALALPSTLMQSHPVSCTLMHSSSDFIRLSSTSNGWRLVEIIQT